MPALGAEMWSRIVEHFAHVEGLLTQADWLVLELASKSYATWRAAEAVLDAKGLTYGTAVVRERPELKIAARERQALDRCLARLGLSPADRVKLSVPAPKTSAYEDLDLD